MEESQQNIVDFSGLRIRVASPEDILSWSRGEITKPETINYRTFKAEKDGLFDERIFGPTKDYECYCGKYKGIRYKGIVCDRCGVEITLSIVRRERMGHISLACPIAHIWFFKGASSALSMILEISAQTLEKIIYYALYLVKSVNKEEQKNALDKLQFFKEEEIKSIEEQHQKQKQIIIAEFEKKKSSARQKIGNKELQEITIQEMELEEREKIKRSSDIFLETKAQKTVMFDRVIKIVKSINTYDTIEEDDYLFLKDREIENCVNVGMGSEVLFEILTNLNIKEYYQETLKNIASAKGERKTKLLKKVRILEALIKSAMSPCWMLLTVLPVVPPDLRPVVQLPGGKFATSDLNDLYRRVINRNNRLKQLIDLGAPEIILRNEKRMLQEAIDSLLDLQKSRGRTRTGQTTGAASKVLKSLSDILRGKQGRFRQNLLGKRVDYSGRSTIIAGPELQIDQCGIPKEMALELFKPHMLHEIIVRGHAPNIKSAKIFLEERNAAVYDILEEIIKDHPVLLNRAPTLHKLSILGFYPVLVDGYAIKLHPTVCSGFNADFDGDTMGVFVPLSKKSIEEVKEKMLPYRNLLKPADGTPIVVPNKEMALGIYYITTIDKNYEKKYGDNLKIFSMQDDAISAYHLKKITLRQPIYAQIDGQTIKTTVGRIMFSDIIPKSFGYINRDIKASDIKNIVTQSIEILKDDQAVGRLIDAIKELGFWAATVACGLSVSVFDCKIAPEKDGIVEETEKKVAEIHESFEQGLLTIEERKKHSNLLWTETTNRLADLTWNIIEDENPVRIIIQSGGARASREQLKQLCAIKGLVLDPMGKVIEVPTKSNYREGLQAFEMVISARGARKGYADSALKTADAGYLTRRLHDVSHDMIVREIDCGTSEGLMILADGLRGGKFLERISGRISLHTVKKGETVFVEAGELITEEIALKIQEAGIMAVTVRSTLYCKCKYGICQKCYGTDLSKGKMASIGTPVGVMAAQSIGEPGTQLTMRVRHFGGIVMQDVTQGLPRVEELFETRTPKVISSIVEFDGKVTIKEEQEKDVYIVTVEPLNEEEAKEQTYLIPITQKMKVKDGDIIKAGTQLSEGHLNVKEILSIRGMSSAQQYLVDEIQDVYESQGIPIHDKHFEVIVRKMSDKIIIEEEGDTAFTRDEVVSRMRFEEENRNILAQGGRPAIGKVSILGITRAAIYTDSWLSAASFEQTTTVLGNAAIRGQIDYLLGLKENVIIGRLIPVEEGLINSYYKKFTNIYANNQSASKIAKEEETK